LGGGSTPRKYAIVNVVVVDVRNRIALILS
jgi:hypothetical protein